MPPEADKLNLPPITSVPSDQHGQLMYALGQLVQGQKDMVARQDITNGKVIDLSTRVGTLERWKAENAGESKGKTQFWLIVFNVAASFGAIATIIFGIIKLSR